MTAIFDRRLLFLMGREGAREIGTKKKKEQKGGESKSAGD